MLPTRHGWTFAAVLVVVLLAAINYNNSAAYGLTFLLAAVAIVSMLTTDRNLLHLCMRIGAGNAVFAGEAAVFRVHVINKEEWPRYGIALMQHKREFARVDLVAHGTVTAELRVATEQRGWLPLP